MKDLENILIVGLVVGAFFMAFSVFTGGLALQYGVIEPEIGMLNETANIYLQTGELRSSAENVTAKETGNLDRAASFIGGTFQSIKLLWKSDTLIRGLVTSMGERLKSPLFVAISGVIFLVIGIKLTTAVLKYIRGIG